MSFWNIKAQAGAAAKMNLIGNIGRWSDIDERYFAQELAAVGDSDLDIYVNSEGGSVFTALTIHNMLARHTGKITITVDGLAASAMTIITSVPNAKVIMPVGSMMMVHAPRLSAYGATAEEMREMAKVLDKVGGGLAGIYKAKTGLDDEKIEQIMSKDTYLTALEAVDLGFADEVGQQLEVAACLSRDKMIVNGLELDPENHRSMPDSWFQMSAKPNNNTGASAGEPTEEQETKPMNLDQLKAEHPELYKAVLAEGEQSGVEKERARIHAIEDMAMNGHEALIAKAKFETGVTAETLAVEIIKAEKSKGTTFLANRQADADEIGDAADTSANEGLQTEKDAQAKKDEDELKAFAEAAASSFNARAGHKIK